MYNENGTAVELKISKEKFEKLFPKTGFALVEQKGYNNCWLVSRLNSMTDSSVGRAKLYSMLEETAEGDILVNLPGSDKPVKFHGGKPANVENALLGEGASPGLEMIHQSVLIKLLKDPAERVDDISKLNLSSLQDEANALSHTDIQATKYLLGKASAGISANTPDYKNKMLDALENFEQGQDMGSSAWGMHQRSIVDYDKVTQQITYHDPYYGGIDITCSLDEFMKNNPSLNIIKADKITGGAPQSSNLRNRTVQSSDFPSATAQVKPQTQELNRPSNNTVEVKENTQTQTPVAKQTLEIPKGFRENGKLLGKRSIINSNNIVMIEKNGEWKRIN